MNLSTIMMLSCTLIWTYGEAQFPWTKNILQASMCGKATCQELIVETAQGKIQGRAFKSILNDTEHYGFLGIPYAKPPVRELRFQAPQPADSWHGIYPAYYERNICLQLYLLPDIIGMSSEDCLYINVYTPEIPHKIVSPKPVIVSIHGGGFMIGAGSRLFYSPDYLITRDVIVVTMNYRLSAFGFLNLGIPEAPGNVGMKDQVLALKWIQQNIAKFGGDPKNILIMGESAGGASVHYHLMSPMSKGLFHKTMIQSGTALTPWALVYDPTSQAFEIGRRCGFKGHEPRKLLKHLKGQSSFSITLAVLSLMIYYRRVYPARNLFLGPSVEKITEGAFLPDFPTNLIKTATPMPTIFGYNNKEGISVILDFDNQLVEKLSRNFCLIVTNNFPIKINQVPEVCSKIKRVYIGDKKVGIKTFDELIDLYSEVGNYYAYDSIKFLTNSSTPPFIYHFAYDGNMNYLRNMINFFKGTRIKGAVHGDDQFYMFYPYMMSTLMSVDDESKRMIDIFTKMLTDFAKTGNPSGIVRWDPSTTKDPAYLLIDRNPKMVRGKFHDHRFEVMRNALDSAMKPGTRPYDIF